MTHIEDIGSQLISELERKNAAREKALTSSRELIRHCALSIRAVHRGENEKASELRAKATSIAEQMLAAVKEYPDLRYAGYVQDSQKELVEASVTYAIINREELPTPRDLGVEPAVYLNGTAEAVGELRRFILDKLRHGDTSRCEEILQVMDDIYSVLVTVDFPDALTGGLRRTTDSVRGIMEKTRGDLTNALRQRDLEMALRRMPGFDHQTSDDAPVALETESEDVPNF